MANEQRQIEFALKTTEQVSTMIANTGTLAESLVKAIMDCIDGSRTAKIRSARLYLRFMWTLQRRKR